MSLRWDLTKVNDPDSLWIETGEKSPEGKTLYRLNHITDGLIWLTIPVMLGEITEKNLNEWCFRLAVLSEIGDFMLTEESGERNPTMDEIERHLGLKVNVVSESRAKFMSNIKRILSEHAEKVAHEYRNGRTAEKKEAS